VEAHRRANRGVRSGSRVWMVFHQNGTTITYWADENTNWNVRGIISNAINPGWVIILTLPLINFWKWLATKRAKSLRRQPRWSSGW